MGESFVSLSSSDDDLPTIEHFVVQQRIAELGGHTQQFLIYKHPGRFVAKIDKIEQRTKTDKNSRLVRMRIRLFQNFHQQHNPIEVEFCAGRGRSIATTGRLFAFAQAKKFAHVRDHTFGPLVLVFAKGLARTGALATELVVAADCFSSLAEMSPITFKYRWADWMQK
ncbi:hypothetical protein BpHYR1_045599 [Brachionus plicatilis]|uniref:Uncharacterized protein n=1 Tax=Brachionus plicatilis TaxID=10195 RepID=A0A3M7S640_BRAPC|nr:hypothetical protein BpHYR1_045599 [Brachionus plicatilis]